MKLTLADILRLSYELHPLCSKDEKKVAETILAYAKKISEQPMTAFDAEAGRFLAGILGETKLEFSVDIANKSGKSVLNVPEELFLRQFYNTIITISDIPSEMIHPAYRKDFNAGLAMGRKYSFFTSRPEVMACILNTIVKENLSNIENLLEFILLPYELHHNNPEEFGFVGKGIVLYDSRDVKSLRFPVRDDQMNIQCFLPVKDECIPAASLLFEAYQMFKLYENFRSFGRCFSPDFCDDMHLIKVDAETLKLKARK